MFGLIKNKRHSTIRLHTIDLGVRNVSIPVADLQSPWPGNTLLVTAGIDGDEYAGMEAAYRLIEEFGKRSFHGRFIIIPIVNIPGFEAGVSWNPLDKKYPKNIFPGKEKGSASERLMYWIYSSFIDQTDFWLDMHGGAHDEEIQPFIRAYETKNRSVDSLVLEELKQTEIPLCLFERYSFLSKAHILSRKQCGYLFTESGQMGERRKVDIQRHVRLAHTVMGVLGMIQLRWSSPEKKQLYRRIKEYQAHRDGLWYPAFGGTGVVSKGELIGEIRSLSQEKRISVYAQEDCVVLWRKAAFHVTSGDILAGIGCERTSFDLFAKRVG